MFARFAHVGTSRSVKAHPCKTVVARRRRGARRRRFEPLEDRVLLSLTAVLVKDLEPGPERSSPNLFTEVDGVAFFIKARDALYGDELWKTDGTPGGTVMVKDINPGPSSSSPRALTAVNGTLFFIADDGTTGRELWRSDGTEAGTVLVKDVNPGPSSGLANQFVDVDGTVFFDGDDGVNGRELWKSDGTEAGTVLVKDIEPGSASSGPREMIDFSGTLFFSAEVFNANDTTGRELWKSDGTEAGTVLVKNIRTDSTASSIPRRFVVLDDLLLFEANDGVTGVEPWKTDGTEAGTVLLKDINPGPGTATFFQPTVFNDEVFFTSIDGSTGSELWKTDGTEAGTVLVKDIRPGSASGIPNDYEVVDGTLYFQVFTDGVTGRELWKTDGTSAGTVLVKDINPGIANADPRDLTDVGGTLFFRLNSGDGGIAGDELWMSDGTEAGTVLVDDINPGPADSSPLALASALGTLFFSADDGVLGRELWKVVDAVDVAVDVRPGGEPNPVNLGSNGMLPVALLSDAGFDAATIDTSDPSTIRFGDPGVAARVSPQQAALEDVDGDGDTDLLLLFSVSEISSSGALVSDSTQAELTAWTLGGEVVIGTDSVAIVGNGASAAAAPIAASSNQDGRADDEAIVDELDPPAQQQAAAGTSDPRGPIGAPAEQQDLATHADLLDLALQEWGEDLLAELVPAELLA